MASESQEKLFALMIQACPETNDRKSLPILAKHMDRTVQGLYKAIHTEKVSPGLASAIVKVAEGRVSLEDFHPWVFRA